MAAMVGRDGAPGQGRQAGAPVNIVAFAASAGGLNALSIVLGALPFRFCCAVVVVQHLDPRHRSLMVDILARRIRLPIKEAEHLEPLAPGMIYIAPPNRHLLVSDANTVSLSRSDAVHFVRPSADLLFQSVAGSHGERAVAVVLSGSGSDGAEGVMAIRKTGGLVIVQDPQSAEFAGMPKAAIRTGQVDFIVPLAEIAPLLVRLAMPGGEGGTGSQGAFDEELAT